MDDADFHVTYHVSASAPIGWVHTTPTTIAPAAVVSHSLTVDPAPAAAHPISNGSTPVPGASVPSASQITHPVTTTTVAEDGPFHPSSAVLGKRRLTDTRFDHDRNTATASSSISQHPVNNSYPVHRPSSHEPIQCSMSVKACVLSNVQVPSSLESNLIITSTLNL
ncbi:hypothetical protein C8J57DRAFT_1705514, partial [Mycena rebaudengoi]